VAKDALNKLRFRYSSVILKQKWTLFSQIATPADLDQINSFLNTKRMRCFIEHGLSIGFYRLNLIADLSNYSKGELSQKYYCGHKFALSLLLLKVWTEFCGKTRMDINQWESWSG